MSVSTSGVEEGVFEQGQEVSMGSPLLRAAGDVRVAVEMGGIKLAYSGGRTFYEQRVLPLLRATCRSQGPVALKAAGIETHPAAPVATPMSDPVAPPKDDGLFRPASPAHFHQFVARVGDRAGTAEQRLMAFGFYLWNYEKQETFSPALADAFFRTVHDPQEESALRDLVEDLSQRKRFLQTESSGDGSPAYRLTAKGVNYVKNRLLSGE